MVIQAAALIKKFRLWRVEVFCVVVGVHRATPKSNRAPPCIADREHDPTSECIIRLATFLAGLGQTGTQNQVFGYVFANEMIPKSLPRIRCKTDLPTLKSLLRQTTSLQISAGLGGRRCTQLQTEILHRLLHYLGKFAGTVQLFSGLWIARRHLHARLTRQNFHRFHKADVLGFFHKRKCITLRLTTKTIIISLSVIDVKTGRFFMMKRARRPHVTLTLVRLARVPHNFAPHHVGDRQAAAQFIKETGRQTHVRNIRCRARRVYTA